MSEENAVHTRESNEEKSEKVAPDRDSLARARAFAKVKFSPTNHQVDWFRLIVQLKSQGYSLYAVAHFTGISKDSLFGYKQGSQPSYHRGVTLLQFWSEVMDCDTTDAPTIDPYSFKA